MGYMGQDEDHLESPGTPSCDSLQTSNPMQSNGPRVLRSRRLRSRSRLLPVPLMPTPFSSCTTALHLALHALGIGLGDDVVTVSHSFIATANAVRYCGATPVFVDIDPRTYNVDIAS